MGHQGVFGVSTPAARRLALDILRRTLDNKQDLQAAVDEALRPVPAGPDKGLATELAYGYLRMRGRIDFLLTQLLKNPLQTSPVMKRILGVGIYELLFLNRIPDYATSTGR
jgi:16S rRNA (cytosine967-C5)-methyltransferase